MITPLGALLDPLREDADLLFRKRRLLVGHADFRIVRENSSNDFTVIGITGIDADLPGFRCVECFSPEQYAVIAVALHTTVAADTPLVQNGLHLRGKIDLLLTAAWKQKKQNNRDDKRSKTFHGHWG